MAITQFTPVDAVKLAINSTGVNTGLITDTRYMGYVIGHALSAYTDYEFQAVTPLGAGYGHYAPLGYSGVEPGLCLLTVGTAPYTEDSGVSSTFHCGWGDVAPSIVVTAGTPTSATLTVRATPIDWRGVIVDVVRLLKSWAAREEDSISLAGAGVGYSTLMERLDLLEQQYRGTFYA